RPLAPKRSKTGGCPEQPNFSWIGYRGSTGTAFSIYRRLGRLRRAIEKPRAPPTTVTFTWDFFGRTALRSRRCGDLRSILHGSVFANGSTSRIRAWIWRSGG